MTIARDGVRFNARSLIHHVPREGHPTTTCGMRMRPVYSWHDFGAHQALRCRRCWELTHQEKEKQS